MNELFPSWSQLEVEVVLSLKEEAAVRCSQLAVVAATKRDVG